MTDFGPRKGPQFGAARKAETDLTREETRGLGFVVGALRGDIPDAALARFAVEHAREAGEDRHLAPKQPRRPLWRRVFRRG